MLKKKLVFLILTQNSEKTIKKTIDSIYKYADKIVVIDGFSEDNTCEILKKKKIKIIEKKFDNCPSSLSYGMNYIKKKINNSLVFRIDSDEILVKKKQVKNLKTKLINDFEKIKCNIKIKRKVLKNDLEITSDLEKFVTRISSPSAKYSDRSMDEVLLGKNKKISYITVHDILEPEISHHIKKHKQWARLELASYKLSSYKTLRYRLYYLFPIFIRSFLFGIFLILKIKINKNFYYNLKYQFIRGMYYRMYIDFLILKKFLL